MPGRLGNDDGVGAYRCGAEAPARSGMARGASNTNKVVTYICRYQIHTIPKGIHHKGSLLALLKTK